MRLQHLFTASAALLAASFLSLGQSPQDLASSLGISFPTDSQGVAVLTQNGKRYSIDTLHKTVTPLPELAANTAPPSAAAGLFLKNCAGCHGPDGKGIKAVGTPNFTDSAFVQSVSSADMQHAIHNGIPGRMPAWSPQLPDTQIAELVTYVRSLASPQTQSSSGTSASADSSEQADSSIYRPGDDFLISLPTGRPTDRHGVYVNFTHRFAYDPAFTGTGRGQELFGLDGVALPSLGVRYGVTDRLSVSLYRSPSLVNRPIQLMAGYNILEEEKGDPFNLMVRASIEGQNNFRKNYTENLEAILSRSITHRAQFYLVPTASFNDRPLLQPDGFASNQIPDTPGVDAFSMGIGLSIDIRPTVALMSEVIPTLVNADELGIHRPAFSFGIQKKIWRHAFTLALTNSPGTTVSQRAATRASFIGDPSADTFGGLTLGFNITRQIK